MIGAGFVLLSKTLENSGQLLNLAPWMVGWIPTAVLALLQGAQGPAGLIVTTHAFLDRAKYEPAVAALHPPYDLAVGRWSLLRDPQGAMFNILRPTGRNS